MSLTTHVQLLQWLHNKQQQHGKRQKTGSATLRLTMNIANSVPDCWATAVHGAECAPTPQVGDHARIFPAQI